MSKIWKNVKCKSCNGDVELYSKGEYYDCPLCGERNDIEKEDNYWKNSLIYIVLPLVLFFGYSPVKNFFSSNSSDSSDIEIPNFNKISKGDVLIFNTDDVEGDSIFIKFQDDKNARIFIEHRYYAKNINSSSIYREGELVTIVSEGLYEYKKIPQSNYLCDNDWLKVYDSIIVLQRKDVLKYDSRFLVLSDSYQSLGTTNSLEEKFIISKEKDIEKDSLTGSYIYYQSKGNNKLFNLEKLVKFK